jgi:RND family efflux transporter MFP subunit
MKIPAFFKKWPVILALCGVVVVGGALAVGGGGAAETYVSADVVTKNVRKTLDVTGDVQSVTDVSLSLGAAGMVAEVPVSVGEVVKAGELLLALSAAQETAAVAQAEEAVAQAEADLSLKVEGATPQDLAVREAAVRAAQAGADGAAADYAAKVTLTSAQVAEAELLFMQAQAERAESLANAAEDIALGARSAIVSVRNGLASADQVLGNENSLVNFAYRDYLGTIRPNTVDLANSAFDRAAERRDLADQAVIALGTTATAEEAMAVNERLSAAFLEASTTLTYTAQVLDATVVDTRGFSNEDLLALKASITTARTSLAAAEAAWRTAYQAFAGEERRQNDAVASAEVGVTSARAAAASTLAAAKAAAESRAADLAQAQAELARTAAPARTAEVAGLEAVVRARRAELAAAQARLADTRIVAPLDGKVTDITVDVGEYATNAVPVVTFMSIGEAYEITVDISESDIALVKPGQPAEVTFDAFGDDRVWAASVLSVNPASKTIEGVIFYEAKVLLAEGSDVAGIKPGMSADVMIITAEVSEAVIVPQRAILERENGEKYIRVMTSEEAYEERTVTIGVRADDGETQILDGVRIGEKVLLSVRAQ